jgi:hypothetical protein
MRGYKLVQMERHVGERDADTLRHLWQTWDLYARWGAILLREPPEQLSDEWCKSIERIANAFRTLAKTEQIHITRLLETADQRLAPFSDPLRLPFRGNRWLDLRREPEGSYSNWLAWLLGRMDSAEEVLRIFNLEDADFAESVHDKTPKVYRELQFQSASGELKRLDIIIEFGQRAILLVEVKMRELEAACGAGNLAIYRDWLESRISDPRGRCAILLVPTPMESPCPGWQVRSWCQVSLNVRLQAREFAASSPNRLLLSAMLLCFSGAVEQNVLRYATGEAISAPETALYLERFLERTQS